MHSLPPAIHGKKNISCLKPVYKNYKNVKKIYCVLNGMAEHYNSRMYYIESLIKHNKERVINNKEPAGMIFFNIPKYIIKRNNGYELQVEKLTAVIKKSIINAINIEMQKSTNSGAFKVEFFIDMHGKGGNNNIYVESIDKTIGHYSITIKDFSTVLQEVCLQLKEIYKEKIKIDIKLRICEAATDINKKDHKPTDCKKSLEEENIKFTTSIESLKKQNLNIISEDGRKFYNSNHINGSALGKLITNFKTPEVVDKVKGANTVIRNAIYHSHFSNDNAFLYHNRSYKAGTVKIYTKEQDVCRFTPTFYKEVYSFGAQSKRYVQKAHLQEKDYKLHLPQL